MILCHKCAGTFDNGAQLNPCQCISGYPRGFEKDLTLEQAATAQVRQEISWLALYVSQGRGPTEPNWLRTLERLKIAMKHSPACGHGTVKWDLLALGEDS